MSKEWCDNFSGVEVKAGETVPVPVIEGHLVHVSQVLSQYFFGFVNSIVVSTFDYKPYLLVCTIMCNYVMQLMYFCCVETCVIQVALGDVKNVKSANRVPVRMTVDGKKFVIGTLSAEKVPQISFDLVLNKDFELSHDWKEGSIYFCGYTAEQYPFDSLIL